MQRRQHRLLVQLQPYRRLRLRAAECKRLQFRKLLDFGGRVRRSAGNVQKLQGDGQDATCDNAACDNAASMSIENETSLVEQACAPEQGLASPVRSRNRV